MKQFVILNRTKLGAIQFALSWVYMASGRFGKPSYAKDINDIMNNLNAKCEDGVARVSNEYYAHVMDGIKNTIREIGTVEVQWFCKDVMSRALEELKNLKVEFVD